MLHLAGLPVLRAGTACRCGIYLTSHADHRRVYPDLDAELRRQHREVLRQATLDSCSRARVNGTEPAAVITARQAACGAIT